MSTTPEQMAASIERAVRASGAGPKDHVTVVQRIDYDLPVRWSIEIEIAMRQSPEETVLAMVESLLWLVNRRGPRPECLESAVAWVGVRE